MISLVDALAMGGTVAASLKALHVVEAFFAKRGKNGNGFTRDDHDTLTLAAARQVPFYTENARALDRLHTDLEEIKEILRDRS